MRSRRRAVLRFALGVALAAAVFALVLPRIASYGDVIHQLGTISAAWAVGLGAATLLDVVTTAFPWMAVLPQLNPRGVLFSHECSPEMFVGAEIRTERGADFVVPPILDAFEALGWPVRGRHIHGHTGAFWHAEQGIPPVPFAASTALRDLALEL